MPDRPRALKVAAYTGGRSVPSARFRVRQYIPALKALGIEVRESWAKLGSYPPAIKALRPFWGMAAICERAVSAAGSFSSDATLLQREMLSTFVTVERFTKPPRALDVDDAIWLYGDGSFARRLAGLSELVICGNDFLAEQFHRWNSNIHILPTAVDTSRYRPLDAVRTVGHKRIGWCGSGGTLRYLEALTPVFKAVLGAPQGCEAADRGRHEARARWHRREPVGVHTLVSRSGSRRHSRNVGGPDAAGKYILGARQVQFQATDVHGVRNPGSGFAGRHERRGALGWRRNRCPRPRRMDRRHPFAARSRGHDAADGPAGPRGGVAKLQSERAGANAGPNLEVMFLTW